MNETMTMVDLGNNNIGADGVRALAEALRVNATVTNFYVYGNDVGGAEQQKIDALLNESAMPARREAREQFQASRMVKSAQKR